MLGFLIGFCFDTFLINLDASLTQSRKLHNLVTFSVLYLVLLLKPASQYKALTFLVLNQITFLLFFHNNNSGSRTSCIPQLVRVVCC